MSYYIYGMAGEYPKRLLINTINIQRVSNTAVDSRGLESTSWSDIATGVKCRLTMQNEAENRSGRNTIVQSWVCIVAGNQDVKASDRIYEPSTGKYFEINSVNPYTNRVGRVFHKTLSLLYRE